MSTQQSINVLLVGRRNVGKTTLAQALTNSGTFNAHLPANLHLYRGNLVGSRHSTSSTGLLQTNLTIIEIDVNPDNPSKPAEQVKQALKCCSEKHSISKLDVICYVSEAGRTQLDDRVIFGNVQNWFGIDFSDMSMIILTHSEELSSAALGKFKSDLESHHESKHMTNYCKLGIFYQGHVDEARLLASFPGEEAARLRVAAARKQKIEAWRQVLLEQFALREGKPPMSIVKLVMTPQLIPVPYASVSGANLQDQKDPSLRKLLCQIFLLLIAVLTVSVFIYAIVMVFYILKYRG